MRHLFHLIFGRQPRHRPDKRSILLAVESLNARIVPSACAGGSATSESARSIMSAMQASRFARAESGESESESEHYGCHGHHAERATFAANLTNATGATGTATFSDFNGLLKVSVTGAAASTNLDVSVNGTSVGTLTTDDTGAGKATITGVTVAAGATVMVGDLNGKFAAVKLTASLAGDTGVSGTASFNTLNTKLKVSASGLTAGTTYDVAVNGTNVGQITAKENGRGKLHMTNPAGVTIAAGSTVTFTAVGATTTTLSGAFA